MYESDLRPVLEHVLAARLAERHARQPVHRAGRGPAGVLPHPGRPSLWPWIDPGQALDADQRARREHGIPRRTLARLITRLEQL